MLTIWRRDERGCQAKITDMPIESFTEKRHIENENKNERHWKEGQEI